MARARSVERHAERKRQFDKLPDGYRVRRVLPIGPTTSRKMSPESNAALVEIAAHTPRWTEWGDGHATSMWSGSCERRGYITVAEDKAGRGRNLYRATDSGVRLVNEWLRAAGRPTLPEHEHAFGEWAREFTPRHTERRHCECGAFESRTSWPERLTDDELHDAILVEPDEGKLSILNAELRNRLDAWAT